MHLVQIICSGGCQNCHTKLASDQLLRLHTFCGIDRQMHRYGIQLVDILTYQYALPPFLRVTLDRNSEGEIIVKSPCVIHLLPRQFL